MRQMVGQYISDGENSRTGRGLKLCTHAAAV
jgi:hypothetical protein